MEKNNKDDITFKYISLEILKRLISNVPNYFIGYVSNYAGCLLLLTPEWLGKVSNWMHSYVLF